MVQLVCFRVLIRRVLLTFFAVGFGFTCFLSEASAQSLLEIHFFDIGQGDSILVRAPSGRNALIDLGPPGGARRLAGYLQQLQIQRINLLLITHPHLDHYGGWRKIWDKFPINTFIDPGFPHFTITYKRFLQRIRQRQIATYSARKDQILDLGAGARLRILWPGQPFLRDTRSDANSNSVVMRLEYKNLRVLFTGDAEADTERKLLQNARWLPSHVLKVAHHGSKHSTTDRFLKAVKPSIAVISCARRNVYRHPSPSTLQKLQIAGISTYITARHGNVILRSDGYRIWLSTRGQGRQQAVQTLTLQSLQPGTSLPPPPTPTHALQQQPERGGWMKSKPQGRELYQQTHSTPTTSGYVASKRSKVFHRHSCTFARLISKRNRIHFRTRQAALRSRRRPARDCMP